MIQKDILAMIKNYETIIIHHHLHPDCDCIGSQLGLKYILQESFPKKQIFAVGKLDSLTEFMGELDDVEDDVYQEALVIIVDVGNKTRICDERFNKGAALIKIDHHPHSETFGDIEWVDTSFASACEMIVDFYVQNKEELIMTKEAARALYAGILTDTGRFYYSAVSKRTLEFGALLYQYDFDKPALYANIYHQSINECQFKGYILSQFTHTEHGLGYMKLSQDILDRFQISPQFAANMVNTLSNIKEVITWIFFVEVKAQNKIRVEFRSRGPIVNELAKKFGGGGHAYASGTLLNNFEEATAVIQEADLLCKEYMKKKE